ncbi:MAG: hypothetical protein J6V66_01055 [Clostridia bacterium]|nr:hypothetical protein [Clostridia bacterium]
MDDIQTIVSFLQRYGAEVVALAVLVCLLTGLLKKIIPEKIKNFVGFIPFVLGVFIYAIYSFTLLSDSKFYEIFNKGIQTGAIATLIYTFLKQLKAGDINNSVSDLLTGILSSKTISEVVKVIKKYCTSNLSEEERIEKIEEILMQNPDIPDDLKETVVKLILQTLNQSKK